MAKPLTVELGYDTYAAGPKLLRFESPPVARAAFEDAVKKARKRKREVTDATRIPDALSRFADRLQLEWHDDDVRRAWITANETHDRVPKKLASELLELALDQPSFATLDQLGVGLQRWSDSHLATLDPILDVLAERRPPLTALSLGDYSTEHVHITRLAHPARIAELYPGLERLRLTSTKLASLEGVALPALQALWLRGVRRDAAAFAALDQPWPALQSLAIGWQRPDPTETIDQWSWLVGGERTPALRHLAITGSTIHGQLAGVLARSPLLAQLQTLDLRDLRETSLVAQHLRERAAAFAHLDTLWLPDTIQIAGLAELGVKVVYREDPARYGSSWE